MSVFRLLLFLPAAIAALMTPGLRAQAPSGTPKISITQAGLHFICTADGQPDMYSWRHPEKAPAGATNDYIIPVIEDRDLEAAAVGPMQVVSGGRTALAYETNAAAHSSLRVQRVGVPGFSGSDATLVNLDQVHWYPAGSTGAQIKKRYYSNFPPLTAPNNAGFYGTTGYELPPGHASYGRYYKRHPGYQPENWNWTLDRDSPLPVNRKRIQARLHLELYHAPVSSPVSPLTYTLVLHDMTSIQVNGGAVFHSNEPHVLHVRAIDFTHGASLQAGGLVSSRKLSMARNVGVKIPHPADLNHIENAPDNFDLLSAFFDVERSQPLQFSSGVITIKVYEGHVAADTLQAPLQIIRLQLPGGSSPSPDLIVAPSAAVDYVQNDGARYFHPTVQAPRWWSFHAAGTLGLYDATGTRQQPLPGRLHLLDPASLSITPLGLSAVDPRNNSQRVPGVHALVYGFDETFYPDVKHVSISQQTAQPLSRIAYQSPDFDIPVHSGSDVLRLLRLQEPLTPRSNVSPSAFVPEPVYASSQYYLAPGFAPEQPFIIKHPVSAPDLPGFDIVRPFVTVANTSAFNDPPTFRWRKNGVLIPGATHSLNHVFVDSVDAQGTYDVVVANSKGSVISNPAVISLADPAILENPQSASVLVGRRVSFTVGAEGTALKYQWRRDGLHIAGAKGTVLTLAKVKPEDQGSYDVAVTGTGGSRISSAAMLTVQKPLAILQQPLGGKVRVGGQVALTVRAVGEGILSYQWRKNGEPVEGAVAYQLMLYGNAEGTAAGSYDVQVTDASGMITSAKAVVTVLNGLPVIVSHPESEEVAAGSAVELAVEAEGAELTYQWRKNGTNLPKATSASFSLTQAKKTDEGIYDCVVSNKSGNVLSHGARLTVVGGVSFLVTPADVSVLNGGAALFTAKAAGDESTVAYQWLFNGKSIAGAVTASLYLPTVDPAKAGLYTVTATRSGEMISASAVLKVDEFGVLIYKISGTGQTTTGGTNTRVALSGFLVVDRLNGQASWIWVSKDGKYNRFIVQPLDRFRSDTTGAANGDQTVFSDMRTESDGVPYSLRVQLWLQGADSLVTLAPGSQTRAPKTLTGHLRNLSVEQEGVMRMVVNSVTISASLDLPSTAQARLNFEGHDEAVERLSVDLVSKGSLEVRPEQ